LDFPRFARKIAGEGFHIQKLQPPTHPLRGYRFFISFAFESKLSTLINKKTDDFVGRRFFLFVNRIGLPALRSGHPNTPARCLPKAVQRASRVASFSLSGSREQARIAFQ